jgi:Xaa-Pro aminopeptidase
MNEPVSALRRSFGRKPDNTPDDSDRIEIGPTQLAFDEWAALGVEAPDMVALREYRLERVREQLRQRDYAGILLFDPLNLRYATDSTNMQLWITHNQARACFIATDGPVVMFDFHSCGHLSYHLPLIDEIRQMTPFFYFIGGSRCVEFADDGMALMETAREIKNKNEMHAMRCAVASCEAALDKFETAIEPGISESELWAHLHYENIVRGGDWIETRLLSSGPRTNPWMSECGSRIIQNGDIVALDTDLIGVYGYCVDISRTWVAGDKKPTAAQQQLFDVAHEHIMEDMEILKPGLTFKELTFGGNQLDEKYRPQQYGVKYHGVGLCDEYPAIMYPEHWEEGGYDGVLHPGMALTAEAYIGEVDGREGVKLEDQILITDTGYELLTHFPHRFSLLR